MGTYTEFKFKAKLKKDTPLEIINFLKRVIIERDLGHNKNIFNDKDVFKPEFDHNFFKCNRWYMLFLSINFDENLEGGQMYEDKGYNVIDFHTEFKNYDDEIYNFIDWINPFVAGRKKKQYIGYYLKECSKERTNLYIER